MAGPAEFAGARPKPAKRAVDSAAGVSRVNGIAGAPAVAGRPRKAAAAGGFSVAAEPAAEASPPAQAVAVGLAGMLALQEAETETAGNKNGQRHGARLLDALRELQQDLLTADGGTERLARLAALAHTPAGVSDPALADILAAIRLRAKIELLRRGVEPG